MTRDWRRNFALALALSLAAHLAMLAIPARRAELLGPSADLPSPLLVQLVAREPAPEAPAATPAAPPEPPAPPRHAGAAHRPLPRPMIRPAPEAPAPPAPAPAEPTRAPPIDMMAILRARRAQRLAQDEAARAANRREPTPGQIAEATIERNLRMGAEGVSGVFQILSKGTRTAEFAFNGWRGDAGPRWRQVIEVEARPGEDIERVIVRRMIELIRTHYSGDFNWESHRLGRVVVLSARAEDNAELEDFLVREFFGTPTLKPPG